MAADQPNKNDEFLQLLAAEPDEPRGAAVQNPFNDDEIIFRDEHGEIKVLKGKQVTPLAGVVAPRRGMASPLEQTAPPAEPLPPEQRTVSVSLPSRSAAIAAAAHHRRTAITEAVESITANHQLKKTFAEAALEKRFKNIILSMLTGVRNAVETRELLTRPLAEGGLEFNQPEATDVLAAITQTHHSIADQAERQPHQPPATLSPEGQKLLNDSSVPIPPKLVFTDPILKLSAAPLQSPPPSSILPKPGLPPSPVRVPQKPPVPLSAPQPKPAPAAAETPIGRKMVQPAGGSPRYAGGAGRPKIEDVKFKPKSMGPVDEIGALTILDFRRLGADPNEAVKTIMEKIELLEQESFSQRLAAIRAWQDSPVYRLYLELGGASMEEKKPVAAVIAERQAAHTPTLTEPEFEAISDLNHQLRY